MKSKSGKKQRQFWHYGLMIAIIIGLMLGFGQSALAEGSSFPSQGNRDQLFANGTPIIIVAGTGDTSTVYVDEGELGKYEETIEGDSGPIEIAIYGTLTTLENYNLSGWQIFGGSMTNEVDSTQITMLGGTVSNIYGGGYSDSATVKNNTNITVSDGLVKDDVHGGGRSGEVHGNTIVNISGTAQIGTPVTSGKVFGGGSIGDVKDNTTVNITGGMIYGDVYGGGGAAVKGMSTVNIGDEAVIPPSGQRAPITLINAVYGGGQGGTTNNTVVNISGDTITSKYIFGGGEGAFGEDTGQTTGTATVNITNFKTTYPIYGGGKFAPTNQTVVTIDNSDVSAVFADGENNQTTPTESATVYIKNGSTVTTVYGGRETYGETEQSTLNISASTVTTVYGSGGRENTRVTDSANINITEGSSVDAVYGGGLSGSSASSNINISNSIVGHVHGGNNDDPFSGITIQPSGPAHVKVSGTTTINNLYLENLANNQFNTGADLDSASIITLVLPEGLNRTIPVVTLLEAEDFATLKLADQHLGIFDLETDLSNPLQVNVYKLPIPPKPDRGDGSIGSVENIDPEVDTEVDTAIDTDTDTNLNEGIVVGTVSTELATGTQDGITEGTAQDQLLQSMVSEALDDFASLQAGDDGQTEAGAGTSLLDIVVELPSDMAADTVNFSFDPAELQNDSEEAEVRLVVQTELGTVAIDQTALESIAQQSSAAVTLGIAKVDSSELSDEQRAQIGDRPLFSLTLSAGDQTISDFGGGSVTVSLPYILQDGENAESIVIFFLADDGTITAMQTVYDPETQTVSFITDHFSYYFIGTTAMLGYLYSDVAPDDWYYAAVQFALDNGLLEGLFDTSFYPTAEASRALMVTLLYRLDLSSLGENSDSEQLPITFADVAPDAYYAQAVAWAAANGIVNGYDADTFAPDDTLTREQMAAVFYRYAEYKGQDTTANATLADFSDADLVSDYAQISLQWAVGTGLIQGKGQGILDPQGITTNAEVVTLLERII